MIKNITIVLLILTLFSGVCQAENRKEVSGEIITGFRILTIQPGDTDIDFTVYRGDYIKFKFPETSGSSIFTMVDLQYKGTVLPDPTKSAFFKMKTAGSYGYSLGTFRGIIKVIELVRPNYSEVTAKQGAEILKNINPFILDVRTRQENRQLHLPDTHLIPIQELQARIGELDTKKHEDIFIYCATGNRSTVASRYLADLGFKRIYNLRYGIYDWARQGLPYQTARK